MAEVRRRKGDGDTIEVAEPSDLRGAADSCGSNVQPTILSNAEKQALLEPLQLSDSATADSSDHVSIISLCWGKCVSDTMQRLLIFPKCKLRCFLFIKWVTTIWSMIVNFYEM